MSACSEAHMQRACDQLLSLAIVPVAHRAKALSSLAHRPHGLSEGGDGWEGKQSFHMRHANVSPAFYGAAQSACESECRVLAARAALSAEDAAVARAALSGADTARAALAEAANVEAQAWAVERHRWDECLALATEDIAATKAAAAEAVAAMEASGAAKSREEVHTGERMCAIVGGGGKGYAEPEGGRPAGGSTSVLDARKRGESYACGVRGKAGRGRKERA